MDENESVATVEALEVEEVDNIGVIEVVELVKCTELFLQQGAFLCVQDQCKQEN